MLPVLGGFGRVSGGKFRLFFGRGAETVWWPEAQGNFPDDGSLGDGPKIPGVGAVGTIVAHDEDAAIRNDYCFVILQVGFRSGASGRFQVCGFVDGIAVDVDTAV